MQEAYIIGNIAVKDETKWAEYKSNFPKSIIPWGGKLVFRGEKIKGFSGESKHKDNIIIRFPNQQGLDDWFKSNAYQALIAIRELGADIDLISYQSIS